MSTTRWMVALVGAALLMGLSTAASAQQSNFGTIRLRAGFTPDPHVARGTSGGRSNASSLGSGCTGWIASNPDHILVLGTGFDFLRIFAESEADTTLVVQMPNGQLRCNDDTYGLNPSVEGNWPQGTYRVWVGSYREGEMSPYQLKLTELRSVQPGGGGGGGGNTNAVDTSGRRANFGTVALRTGFTPDPHRASGRSGGSVDAATVSSSCNGWIATTPDHILNLQTPTNFFRVFVTSEADTTLVIRTPDGRWLCNDDTNGLNPIVEQQRWARGRYLVWVGSYEQGAVSPYNIGFTELTGVNQ